MNSSPEKPSKPTAEPKKQQKPSVTKVDPGLTEADLEKVTGGFDVNAPASNKG